MCVQSYARNATRSKNVNVLKIRIKILRQPMVLLSNAIDFDPTSHQLDITNGLLLLLLFSNTSIVCIQRMCARVRALFVCAFSSMTHNYYYQSKSMYRRKFIITFFLVSFLFFFFFNSYFCGILLWILFSLSAHFSLLDQFRVWTQSHTHKCCHCHYCGWYIFLFVDDKRDFNGSVRFEYHKGDHSTNVNSECAPLEC